MEVRVRVSNGDDREGRTQGAAEHQIKEFKIR